jgi:dTDP-D-glucose 4,6-dehydratase
MNVAVTGAAGGIGKATVLKLIKNGSQVLAIDLPGANFEYLDSIDCEILFADVSEEEDRNIIVEKSLGFDGLVNAAGKIDTKSVSAYSIEEIRSFFRVNFESIWDLTSRIGASMPKGGSIVNVSSAGAKVITNSNVGPYSATKAAADMLVIAWARTYDIPYVIVRPTNNYGIGQYVEKFIPKACKNLSLDKPIVMHDNGNPVRTWLHVSDTANAVFVLVLMNIKNDIFNISGNYEEKNIVIARKIIDNYFGHTVDYDKYMDFSEKRQGQDVRYAIGDSKLRDLGWACKADFDTRLKEIVEWHRENFVW